MDAEPPRSREPQFVEQFKRTWKHYLDKTVVWTSTRWGVLAFLALLYIIRVSTVRGFYVVTYGLGIYLLNLLIGFLSPQVDPETDTLMLPTDDAEEYRPFVRKLPEFQFWLASTKAVVLCLFLTLNPVFDLPVFWPILLAYFLLLFFLTMKQQVKHMIDHKYIPFSWGKQTYGDLKKFKVAEPGASVPMKVAH